MVFFREIEWSPSVSRRKPFEACVRGVKSNGLSPYDDENHSRLVLCSRCIAPQVNFKATANGHPKGANPLNNSDTEVRFCRVHGRFARLASAGGRRTCRRVGVGGVR